MTVLDAPIGRPSDEALWRSVAITLRDAVLPHIDDPHTRQVVIHLVGLAYYARDRGVDPTAGRLRELADVLDALVLEGNPLVVGRWSSGAPRERGAVMAACADVLAAGIDADDPATRDAGERLRAVLIRHLDDDLAVEGVMLETFRGRLPDE
jgi:hypothetical protein